MDAVRDLKSGTALIHFDEHGKLRNIRVDKSVYKFTKQEKVDIL